MWYAAMLAAVTAVALSAALVRYGNKRRRLYRELADRRERLIAGHEPRILTSVEPRLLRPSFARDPMLRVAGFLAPESLESLRAESETSRVLAERSYIPRHKKGGTLSYEGLHHHAPACLALYHSPALRGWLSEVVGEPVAPTADHDQSSCSILYYDRAGDHIHWHYDYNFYRGRHFTVLLSLVNRGADTGVSAGRLMRRARDGEESEWDTSENVLVMFEGARVYHQASPVSEGDKRVMLSMTFSTDPRIHPVKELARRIKDTAYYGPRALID